jgi:hypothetical protein
VGAAALRFGRAPGARRVAVAVGVAAGAVAAAVGLSAIPQQSSRSASKGAAAAAVPELNGDLAGTIENDGGGVVSISGTAATSAFRIDLLTNDGQRVSDSALQVRFPSGATCEGTLTALDQSGFSGTCNVPGGGTRTVQASWTVSGGSVSGTISTSGDAGSTDA